MAGAGSSLLLEAVARVTCDPKDVILTPGPIWPVFTGILSKAGVSLSVILPAGEEGSVSTANALEELENLLNWTDDTQWLWESQFDQLVQGGKRPRAILLSNPQNPLGRCYTRSFLVRALEFCEKVRCELWTDR